MEIDFPHKAPRQASSDGEATPSPARGTAGGMSSTETAAAHPHAPVPAAGDKAAAGAEKLPPGAPPAGVAEGLTASSPIDKAPALCPSGTRGSLQAPAGQAASAGAGGEAASAAAADAEAEAEAEAQAARTPRGPAVSAHLARLLASAPPDAAGRLASHQLAILVVHAAMMESGFRSVPAAAGTANGAACDARGLLAGARVGGGTYTLAYELGGGDGGGAGSSGAARGSAGAAVTLRCMEVGPHLVVAGVAAAVSPQPGPVLIGTQPAAAIGGTLGGDASGGGGGGGSLQSLTLSVERFCRAPAAAAGPAEAAAVAAAGAGGGAEDKGQAQQQQEGQQALVARLGEGLQDLWLLLRDRLALPLLASAAAAAGLPPPAGLLTLPWELQEAWLKLLPVRHARRGAPRAA
jgi:flagellar hook-length control protein FliK